MPRPRSVTAFKAALQDGQNVHVEFANGRQGDVVLEIASSQIGYHFFLDGVFYVIPALPAGRSVLIDNGITFNHSDGSPWVSITMS